MGIGRARGIGKLMAQNLNWILFIHPIFLFRWHYFIFNKAIIVHHFYFSSFSLLYSLHKKKINFNLLYIRNLNLLRHSISTPIIFGTDTIWNEENPFIFSKKNICINMYYICVWEKRKRCSIMLCYCLYINI